MLIARIISGGQTGADRGAWDAALEAGVPIGGWVPRDRWAEDGAVPLLYGEALPETATSNPAERTEANVVNSSATLILSHGPLQGGTRLTAEMAQRHDKRWLHVDLAEHAGGAESSTIPPAAMDIVRQWLHELPDATPIALNVAGPRASEDGSIRDKARALVGALLRGQSAAANQASGKPTSADLATVFNATIDGMVDVPGGPSGVLYMAPVVRPPEPQRWPPVFEAGAVFWLTGWNPRGQAAQQEQNREKNRQLLKELHKLSSPQPVAIWHGFNFNVADCWREDGFAAAFSGADAERGQREVLRLAQLHNQAAIFAYRAVGGRLLRSVVWCGRTAASSVPERYMERLAGPPAGSEKLT